MQHRDDMWRLVRAYVTAQEAEDRYNTNPTKSRKTTWDKREEQYRSVVVLTSPLVFKVFTREIKPWL